MNKITFKPLLVMLVFSTPPVHSESIEEIAFMASINAICSVNKETYEKCFQLSEDGCKEMLTKILPECSQNKYVFPVHQKDIQDFSACVNKKFEEKLISDGIESDAPCSK